MTDTRTQSPPAAAPPPKRGDRKGPLGFLWTALRIANARLRFVLLMVVVGLVASQWENIAAQYDRWTRPAHAPDSLAHADVEHYCPMHPGVVSDHAGNCPICGMPLVKRDRKAAQPMPAGVLAQVTLTPQRVRAGRIGTSPVEYRLLARQAQALGVVQVDETRRATITARFKGRLDKLLVNYTGQKVQAGQTLAMIYSPDLLVAQEELLSAVRNTAAAGGQDAALAATLVEASRRKLALWGLSEQQIESIIAAGSVQTHLAVSSPIGGIITEKKALEGRYLAEGDELYTVADLSKVWLQVKLFPADLAGVGLGTVVLVTSEMYPDEMFAGRVSFIAYEVDPLTRTVAARVEVDNPDDKLRPGEYASAIIRTPVGAVTPLGDAATMPASQPATPVDTTAMAKAYLALADAMAADRAEEPAIAALADAAGALADKLPQARPLADATAAMKGLPLQQRREAFKGVSAAAIAALRQARPAMPLSVVYCPMVDARWLSAEPVVRNPYDTTMSGCGTVEGPLAAAAPAGAAPTSQPAGDERTAVGYYCPIYPDRVFAAPRECPADKFPLRPSLVEKAPAVPVSAVIDTGSRKVVYRESSPGVFDMVEVRLGPRAGEYYPVLDGLTVGQRVATAGAFLVDAENRLNPAAGAQYFGAGGHQH